MITQYIFDTKSVVSSHAGATLKVWTEEIQIMSDVWENGLKAMVWDEESQSPKTLIVYISGSLPVGSELKVQEMAAVDATPEVLEKYSQWVYNRELDILKGNVTKAAAKIEIGKTVRVVRGRNNKGQSGKVFKLHPSSYRAGYRSISMNKVGIALSDETVPFITSNGKTFNNFKDVAWVWETNIEVENPSQYEDFSEVEERAIKRTKAIMATL